MSPNAGVIVTLALPCPAPSWLSSSGRWSINRPSEEQNGKKSSKVSDKLNRDHPTLKDHGVRPREVTLWILTAAVTRLPGSEVPDAITTVTTASSPGQTGPGRQKAHVKQMKVVLSRRLHQPTPRHITPHVAAERLLNGYPLDGYPPLSSRLRQGNFHGMAKSGLIRLNCHYDRAVNWQSPLHVRSYKVAGWRAQLAHSLVPAQ